MGFLKDLFGGLKSALTGNLLGTIGSATSMSMGLGETKRQKKLMDYQDKINDENYAKQRADSLADYHMQLADQRALRDEDRQYNSISAQMQRARDANVSPLAALGVSANSSIGGVSPVSSSDTGSVSPTSNNSASHFGNAITLVTTLKELKQRDKEIKIKEDLTKQQIRESETRAILNELQANRYDEETTARIHKLVAEGKTEEARAELTKAQTTTEGAKQAELLSTVALNDAKTMTEDYLRSSKLDINKWQAKAMQADIARSFSQIRVDDATIDSIVDSLATNEVSRKKMSQEISNLVVARDKAITEIKRIESDTSLDKTRKQQMIAGIVRDYAFSATSIVNAVSNFMPTKSMSKGQSFAWNELVDIAGVSAVLD